MKEFNVTGYTNSFRFKERISPTKLLSFAEQIAQAKTLDEKADAYDFVCDNTEVSVGDTWVPLRKRYGVEGNYKYTYMPDGIETNLLAIQQIVYTFMEEVLSPVFQNSSE